MLRPDFGTKVHSMYVSVVVVLYFSVSLPLQLFLRSNVTHEEQYEKQKKLCVMILTWIIYTQRTITITIHIEPSIWSRMHAFVMKLVYVCECCCCVSFFFFAYSHSLPLSCVSNVS